MKWSDLCAWLGATPPSHEIPVKGISTDTRSLQAGDVFVALSMGTRDGHSFLPTAIEKGAVGAIVSHPFQDLPIPTIRVPNTLTAYGQIAAQHRHEWLGKVIGITGSVGKTSTKHFLAALLSSYQPTLATEKNYNNEIGVPKTLLRLKDEAFAVVEMGAVRRGDIAYLADLARPDVAIITKCAPAHLSTFHDIQTIVEEKGELFAHLAPNGHAVMGDTHPYVNSLKARLKGQPVITYGGTTSDVRAENVQIAFSGTCFDFYSPWGSAQCEWKIPGLPMLENVLGAMTAALLVGMPFELVVQEVAKLSQHQGRLRALKRPNGATVIDDAYNANPTSVCAAIDVLGLADSPKILVLGDMMGLGETSRSYHVSIGEHAKSKEIDHLLAIGSETKATCEAFGDGAQHFVDKTSLVKALEPLLVPTATALVKGSLASNMAEVLTHLFDEGVVSYS